MSDAQSIADYTYSQLVNNYNGDAQDHTVRGLLTHLAVVFPDVPEDQLLESVKTDPRFIVEIGEAGVPGTRVRVVCRIALVPGAWKKPIPGELDLDHIFMYHAPVGDDQDRYIRLREAAKKFAQVIVAETPVCADQTAAVRHIRDAVMTANSAIALKGRLHIPREDKPAS